MKFLDQVRRGKLPLDPDFHFNVVDVRDVAAAMIGYAPRPTAQALAAGFEWLARREAAVEAP
jgi:hypothetical protein